MKCCRPAGHPCEPVSLGRLASEGGVGTVPLALLLKRKRRGVRLTPWRASGARGHRYLAVADRPRTGGSAVTGSSEQQAVPELSVSGRDELDALIPLIYGELRSLAHRQLLRFGPGDTLNTTALVHEAFVKLAGQTKIAFNDRDHFLRIAARGMRQILVDHARSRLAQKRGGGAAALSPLPDFATGVAVESQATALVALNEALTKLASLDERLARVVELRFFAGLSAEEVARISGVSLATVKRQTKTARAFLYREITDSAPPIEAEG